MVQHRRLRSLALAGLALGAPLALLTTGCLDPQAGTDAQVPLPALDQGGPSYGGPQGYPSQGYPPSYGAPSGPSATAPSAPPPYAPPPAPPPRPAPVPQAAPPAPLPPIPGMAGPPPPIPPATSPPVPPASASLPPLPPAPPRPARPEPPPPAPEAPPPPPQAQGSTFPFPFPFGLPGSSPSPIPSAGPATAIDPNIAGVAAFPLQGLAQREAPGMAREGVTVAANFREGQTFEQPFRMLPGRCYTVLAIGQGVSQLELAIVAVTPLPQASGIIARATGTNSVALGGRGDCVHWDLPIGIHAKYVLRAARGNGPVAAQLFAK